MSSVSDRISSMASNAGGPSAGGGGGVELAPLRSLDDFLMGKARFQVGKELAQFNTIASLTVFITFEQALVSGALI